MSIIYSKEFTKFQFGESTSFVFWKKKKGAKIQYQSSNSMNNRIRDLTFLLSIIELNEIVLEDEVVCCWTKAERVSLFLDSPLRS